MCRKATTGFCLISRAIARLAKNFFRSLKLAFFAGAALSETTRAVSDDVAVRGCGARIQMMSGFGATETAPPCSFV